MSLYILVFRTTIHLTLEHFQNMAGHRPCPLTCPQYFFQPTPSPDFVPFSTGQLWADAHLRMRMRIRTMLRMILVLPTSSSLHPPHKGTLLLALPAHLSSTSGTLWSKAGLHVHAEAVLAVLDDLRRGDDLLVVVEHDRFSLTSNFHDLHLAWIELLHLPVVIITIIMGCTQIPISTLSHIYGFLCVYMG